MIQLNLEPYCENCRDLELNKISDNTYSCANRERCKTIANYIRKELTQNES